MDDLLGNDEANLPVLLRLLHDVGRIGGAGSTLQRTTVLQVLKR